MKVEFIFKGEKIIKMSDKLTVAEFVELTKNQYGSEIIIKLKKSLWN